MGNALQTVKNMILIKIFRLKEEAYYARVKCESYHGKNWVRYPGGAGTFYQYEHRRNSSPVLIVTTEGKPYTEGFSPKVFFDVVLGKCPPECEKKD